LDAPARDRVLDRDDDDVADRSVLAVRTAQHLDAHDTTRAGIVRHIEIGLHLNHGIMPSCSCRRARSGEAKSSAYACWTRVQRLFFEIGAHSSIHTVSPT